MTDEPLELPEHIETAREDETKPVPKAVCGRCKTEVDLKSMRCAKCGRKLFPF